MILRYHINIYIIACKVPPIFITQTSCNGTVAGHLELNSYPDKFSSRFYILHINIHNLHLIHKTNCQNYCGWLVVRIPLKWTRQLYKQRCYQEDMSLISYHDIGHLTKEASACFLTALDLKLDPWNIFWSFAKHCQRLGQSWLISGWSPLSKILKFTQS